MEMKTTNIILFNILFIPGISFSARKRSQQISGKIPGQNGEAVPYANVALIDPTGEDSGWWQYQRVGRIPEWNSKNARVKLVNFLHRLPKLESTPLSLTSRIDQGQGAPEYGGWNDWTGRSDRSLDRTRKLSSSLINDYQCRRTHGRRI